MRYWMMDNDGDEQRVSEVTIRRLAKNNGFLDVDGEPIEDVIENIEQTHPDVTFAEVNS